MSMIHIASDKTASKFDTDFEEVCVQPNAYDLRLDKVFAFDAGVNEFSIDEISKSHRKFYELKTYEATSDHFYLDPGVYQVVMQETIQVAEGEAGFVITRSSLNRNGVFLTTGLYDSGYHGSMAAVMHITVGRMKIKRGTRIGQFLMFKSETLNMYDGSYGVGKAYDAKYE